MEGQPLVQVGGEMVVGFADSFHCVVRINNEVFKSIYQKQTDSDAPMNLTTHIRISLISNDYELVQLGKAELGGVYLEKIHVLDG